MLDMLLNLGSSWCDMCGNGYEDTGDHQKDVMSL